MAATGPQDPGWRPNLKMLLTHLVMPWLLPRTMSGGIASLTQLRTLWLGLFMAGPLILLVLVLVMPFGDPSFPQALLAIAAAVWSILGARLPWRRPLDASSRAKLSQSYRTTFFLAFALCESGMLWTFVLSFTGDGYWPFLIGLAGFVFGMLHIAPSRSHLDRKDAELRARGSRYSLTEALSSPPEDEAS